MTSTFDSSLPPEVLESLHHGSTVDAIKLLRKIRGLGMKEAKDAIDAHLAGDPAPLRPPPPMASSRSLPEDVAEAMRQGNKIEAIRLLRAQTGLGLKDAKDAVENGVFTLQPPDEGSPGQVSGTGGPARWVVAAVVAGAVAYYFLR